MRIDSATDDTIRVSLTVAIQFTDASVNRYTPSHAGNLLSQSLILLASVHSRGTRYPAPVSFVTTPQGRNVPRTPVA